MRENIANVGWVNFYSGVLGKYPPCDSAPHETPQQAQLWAQLETDFIRVEERWNGHVRCTPVGMRSNDASHYWARIGDRISDFLLVAKP